MTFGTSTQYELVHARIAKAAALARRSPDDVALIAVTKGRDAYEIEPLIEAGHRDFGESRVQEALANGRRSRGNCESPSRIGRLQSNKAREAVRLFDVIHSVDRPSLLDALVEAAATEARSPSLYIQVNIGDEPQKGGCPLADVGALIEAVRASPMSLAGLMAIPPLGVEPSPFFALLAKLARRHDVAGLSMGMSGDFEAAVMLGSTAVRVGSALFQE